jgi:anti-sigma factor RsiW
MNDHLRDEQIQDALDGRLSEPTLASLRDHIRSCEPCRARWEALAQLKQWTAKLPALELPATLPQAVSARLDAEDRGSRSAKRGRGWVSVAAATAGLAALVALTAKFMTREQPARPESLPVEVAQDFRDLRSGDVALSIRTASPAELERHLSGSGLGFPTRVFDLAMMKQHLLGGKVSVLSGRPAALVAYRGEDGSLLVCRMFRGTVAELPTPPRQREHEAIAFRIFDDGELTLVFWQEGEVVCVLVGDGPPEAIVALAFAKAMKAVA